MEEFEVQIEDTEPKENNYNKDLYKKWFRSKERAGFLAIRPWFDSDGQLVNKIVVDIGQADPSTNKLTSSTQAFPNAVTVATFLQAVTAGRGALLYPTNERGMVTTPEGLTLFGGSKKSGKPMSTVFKIQHYPLKDGFDSNAFQWKVGKFEANETNSGAFMPNFQKPISVDSIKVSRPEMAEISYLLNLALTAHAVRKPDLYGVEV